MGNIAQTSIALGPYLYLPSGWDTAWKTAKAAIGSQRAYITGIGDSIMSGQGSSNILTTSWWALMRSAILAANGNQLGGDLFGMNYTPMGYNPPGSPLTLYGVQNTDYYWAYAAFSWALFSNSTVKIPLISCTTSYPVTGFDIIYIDYVPGVWTYNIDGGSNTTVTCTGNGAFANSIVKKVSITGLTSGVHTLNINSPDTNAACVILGITPYASSSGFCFANMALASFGLVQGSAANASLSDTALMPPDKLSLYQGYTGKTSAPTALTGFGFPAQPDLAIIAIGVNDAGTSITRIQYRDALDRLVRCLRFGKSDACSIIIAAMYQADGTLATSTAVTNQEFTQWGLTPYHDFRAAMLEVAQCRNCAFVDVYSAFGNKPVSNGWITSATDIHPTNAGHAKIASLMGSIV